VTGVHFGAGDDPICQVCGARKSSKWATSLCSELMNAIRGPIPVKHDYDPFEKA
jgi:hypothetical protein